MRPEALALGGYFIYARKYLRKAVAAFPVCGGLTWDASVEVLGDDFGSGDGIPPLIGDPA